MSRDESRVKNHGVGTIDYCSLSYDPICQCKGVEGRKSKVESYSRRAGSSGNNGCRVGRHDWNQCRCACCECGIDRHPAEIAAKGVARLPRTFRAAIARRSGRSSSGNEGCRAKGVDTSTSREIHGGFVLAKWCGDPATEEMLSELKVTIRCLPVEQSGTKGRCILTGKEATLDAIFAKSY